MTEAREIKAYFHTAQDARRAMNALERDNVKVETPEPVQRPQNGRAWLLRITPVLGGLSPNFGDPTMLNKVVAVVLKFNGITNVGTSLP